MNHLGSEKSPYLLQHANNPVDWYPWGEEAFTKARSEDKPIFLSVGYSTCHWCHVMERESFENAEIASLLNEHFVPVKVDREERPDVDRIYMTFVQLSTQSGGWPMSVFLTPDLKPFLGGTYFPPEDRYGRPGFRTVLGYLAHSWKMERGKIEDAGENVLTQLASYVDSGSATGTVLDPALFDSAFHYFRRTFDSKYAGFGQAPKFPRPVALNFLLRYHARAKNVEALEMTVATLRAMAEGGMNDQLAGGFHRYSVDERWFVPHFEKMLYDQAQLAISYLEAFQITRERFLAETAVRTLDYVLRDMTSPEGAFYSAEDADSVIDPANPHEKGEGAFYVWTADEIERTLGPKDAALFERRFGVEKDGNVHEDPHGEFGGRNILYVARPMVEGDSPAIERSISLLIAARSKRVRPHLDDKVLTAWNGLMISAFAKAAQILEEPRFLNAARRSAEFILSRMFDQASGILLRRYRDGDAAIAGFLDDYAFFAAALLDLYEADFDVAHLETAVRLTDKMLELFEDRENGAFFAAAEGDASLVLRLKDDYDGAEPSGNSIAWMNLLRLAQITNRPEYHSAAERTARALAPRIAGQPVAVPQMLVAAMFALDPKRQIVLAGDPRTDGMRALLHALRGRFLPGSVVLLADSEETRTKLSRFAPEIREMREVNGRPTAFVCRNYACELPVNDASRLDELLQ
jgi:uncharacterized protein YyaL (SSP411 family)